MTFTGTFKAQKLDSLKDLAWALALDEKGTKNELLERIQGHFSLPANKALRKDKRYVALFGKRKRGDETSDDETSDDETSDDEPAGPSTDEPGPSANSTQRSPQRRRLDEVGNFVSSPHRPSTSQPGPSAQAVVHAPPFYPFPSAPPQFYHSFQHPGPSFPSQFPIAPPFFYASSSSASQ
ncbi:hypothetical protein MSAN_01064300 [Mycena sanguinolenta]|uniref:SAP domain-containing protein n=1 Tax=Mycena sanguinolenta TaxID=230812 RepID=A0A8H6YUD9_9AGAR|nr:hypothetical protein MSAN_01064300 [Mycena sanguinolenta]